MMPCDPHPFFFPTPEGPGKPQLGVLLYLPPSLYPVKTTNNALSWSELHPLLRGVTACPNPLLLVPSAQPVPILGGIGPWVRWCGQEPWVS